MKDKAIKKLERFILNILGNYGVCLVRIVRNIQGTYDVGLDQNIYYKTQEKMEKEIRELGQINDIYYQDIA